MQQYQNDKKFSPWSASHT